MMMHEIMLNTEEKNFSSRKVVDELIVFLEKGNKVEDFLYD